MPACVRFGLCAVGLTAFGMVSIGASATEDDKSLEPVSSELGRLEMFVGPWNVTENHFDTSGDVVATAKGIEEITWILDRRAIRRVYRTASGPTVFSATGTLTWNDVEGKYHGVWFDNISTSGPAVAKGEWMDETRTMVFTLESLSNDGSAVLHKVVEQFVDEEQRVATTYSVRGTELVKRMEVRYKRAAPCPERIRPIFDEVLGRSGE